MFGEVIAELEKLRADLDKLPERIGQAVAGAIREELERGKVRAEAGRPEGGNGKGRKVAAPGVRKARSARQGA